MTTDKLSFLRLARSQNVGPSTFFRLLEIFSSPKNALENIGEFAKQGGASAKIKIASQVEIEKEIEKTKKFGAEILVFNEENYPSLLSKIPDRPPVLTIKGKTELLSQPTIAVVGARNASFNAITFAKKVATDLANNSIIVVSGLARGVDTAAHQAALKNGTIAVIAGGIDNIYPNENKDLFAEIFAQGLMISEQAFGAPPKPNNFVQRNRLISGLSLGVVVVEAGLKSGSLTTARFAIEQGREVFAVPGSPLDARCLGTNRLIKDGAKMLEEIEDILEELSSLKMRFAQDKILREAEPKPFLGPAPKIPSEVEIKEIREEIFTKLSSTPIAIEEIATHMQASFRLINIALVQLELADKIEVKFDKVVRK